MKKYEEIISFFSSFTDTVRHMVVEDNVVNLGRLVVYWQLKPLSIYRISSEFLNDENYAYILLGRFAQNAQENVLFS